MIMEVKRITIVLLVLLLYIPGKSINMNPKRQKEVLVTFEESKKKTENICNHFSLYFVHKGIIYRGQINGCMVKLPLFPSNIKKVDIIFNYGKYWMVFDNLDVDRLLLNINGMNWNFKVEYPPFVDERGNKDLNKKNLVMIYYMQFMPRDQEGIEIIKPIYK